MSDLPYGNETYQILGACFEVYNDKGCGLLEPIYQECLEIEFGMRGIPFKAQVELDIFYKEHKLEKKYQPDFVCFGEVLLEIKAVSQLTDEHRAQLINW